MHGTFVLESDNLVRIFMFILRKYMSVYTSKMHRQWVSCDLLCVLLIGFVR